MIQGSRDVAHMIGEITPDYVLVPKLLEQADFANGGARNTLIFRFQSDLL